MTKHTQGPRTVTAHDNKAEEQAQRDGQRECPGCGKPCQAFKLENGEPAGEYQGDCCPQCMRQLNCATCGDIFAGFPGGPANDFCSDACTEEDEANGRLIAAAPELLHALKWAAEYVSLYTGDGAGWTGVQQGHDRERFIDDATGNFDVEGLRAFLSETINKAEEG